jgi:hypothetical protein
MSSLPLLFKRLLAASVTLLAVLAMLLALQWTRNRLGDESTLTGWALLVSTAGLFLLTARKRRVVVAVGPVSAWLQAHVYMGLFSSAVFLMHIGWPVRGPFEIALATCFVIVAGSGAVLGIMSRTVPRKLAALSRDYRFEQIPALQVQLAVDAHELALASADSGQGATLTEYYQRRLLPFFQLPRSVLYRWLPTGVKRRQLLRELNDLDRYLAESGVVHRQRLSSLVHWKDDLDYHLALQTRLRWLFAAHVALTWTLALMVAVHVVLVYRFQGAM